MTKDFLRGAAAIFTVLLAPGFAAPLGAQTANDETVTLPSFQVSTSQDKGYLAENSVSATRIATPIADLPFSISAFTPQFIQDTGALDLYDVVKYAAGVTSGAKEFNAGEDSFTIRGFQQFPERNGFAETGQGNIYVDPVNIERVEVVKGPAALLYGQVAPGGTVNYITKQPEAQPFVVVGTGVGSDSYYRETIDVNQPLAGDTLLFRFNGAYENGFAFENIPTTAKTTVLSPSLTWNPTKQVSIKVNYQSLYRDEDPAEVYPPNMEVATPSTIVKSLATPYSSPSAALPSKTGVDAAAGFNDAADPGFAGPYPGLPDNFDYDNVSDYRRTYLQSVNAEVDVTLGQHWVARADFDFNRSYVTLNQTGVGDVYIAPPGSLVYSPGTGGAAGTWAVSSSFNALSAAQQTADELAFGQQLLANPSLALQAQTNSSGSAAGNPAIIARRPRVQYVYGDIRSAEADFAGDYAIPWGKLKPLIGAYYDANWSYNLIHLNTGSATSPYYQTWDVDPGSPTFYINQDPTPIPPSQFTSETPFTLAWSSDQAAYGILNASFARDTIMVIAGARYNQSQSVSTNFLGTTPAAVYLPGFRAHYTTPQAGIGYKVTPDSMLYASYSTSYQFTGGFLTNPELINGVETAVDTGQEKPVTAEGEEVGYKTDFSGGRLSSTLSVYRIVQSDGIQTVNQIFTTGTIATTVQGVTVRSQGVEFEMTWSPLDNFQVFGNISEDDARNTGEPIGDAIYLGVHPAFTAKTLSNVWSRYSFPQGSVLRGFWVGGGFNYVGPTNGNVADPYLIYPSYTLWNSAAGYDWSWEKTKFSVVLNWDNMTNRFYQPADQEVGLPSRATVTLTARF